MITTECIILAAGYSSRANTNKMLLPLGDRTVLECCVDSLYPSCSHTFVIGGHRIDELRPILARYQRLTLVHNSNYSDGMFSSVITGLQQIKSDRFFLTPGDYPLIQRATIELMLEMEGSIIIPRHDGIAGHPVLMKSDLIPEILSGGYGTLREFISTQAPTYLEVNDVGIITDIDNMKDYYKILARIN